MMSTEISTPDRPSVLEPVEGVPVLGPTHPRAVVGGDSVSMVGDGSLQHVDGARPALVVVDRTEDTARLDGHHSHSKLTPCHPLDLRAEIDRREELTVTPFVSGATGSELICQRYSTISLVCSTGWIVV